MVRSNFGSSSLNLTMENYHSSDTGSWVCSTAADPPGYTAVGIPVLPQGLSSTSSQVSEFPSWPLPTDLEERAANASRSHSLAEKRRRDRINGHLATLRKLIPKSDKMDKAALLGSVIEQVRELKRKAIDVSKAYTVPTEFDEVNIEYHTTEEESFTGTSKLKDKTTIKASVCCDDRPEVLSELIQVLSGLRLTAIQADIASVGGRMKSVLILCSMENEETQSLQCIRHSLRSLVNRISSESMVPSCRIRSKRQRFFLPSHSSQ